MSERVRVLVVDRDPSVVKSLLNTLRESGYEPYGTSSPKAACAIIPQFPLDVIVSNVSCGASVMNAARAATRTHRRCRVLLLSPNAADSNMERLAEQVDATIRIVPVEQFAAEMLEFIRTPAHMPQAA